MSKCHTPRAVIPYQTDSTRTNYYVINIVIECVRYVQRETTPTLRWYHVRTLAHYANYELFSLQALYLRRISISCKFRLS